MAGGSRKLSPPSREWTLRPPLLPDAAEEGLDRGEGDIWPVTEDGVTCAGQAHQTRGASGEPAVEVLSDGQWADRVVLAREDQHRAFDHAQHGPRVQA